MWLSYYGEGESVLNQLKQGKIPLISVANMAQPFLRNQPMADTRKGGISHDRYRSELAKQYERLPAHLKMMVDFEYFVQQSEAKRADIEKHIRAQRSGPEDALTYPWDQYRNLALLRLFSQSTHYNLWQYLGAQHQGVCLELAQPHNSWQSKKGSPAKLAAVNYGEEKVVKGSKDNPFPGLLAMPTECACEQEWRFIKPIQGDQAFLPIARDLVLAIVLGCHRSEALAAQFEQLITQDMRYRQVKLFQAVIDPYRLTFKKEVIPLTTP